jgi:ribosomal-protein-alanine N-acetyltransferase
VSDRRIPAEPGDDLALTGPTLRVRIPRLDDAPSLLAAASDPEVTRWFSWGPYSVQAEAEAYLDRLPGQRAEGEQLDLAQDHHEDGVIGITGLSEFSRRDRRAIVGTWFGRQWWGTGANRESKALVMAMGFRALGLNRITALASPQNVRSIAALERLGFVREGVLRGWHVHRGVPRDVAVLRMMRDEWEHTPLAEVPVEIDGDPPPAFAYSQRK